MIAKVTTRPPAPVLAAFDVDAALLQPLHGGQGMAWSAGELVLKPLDMSLDALVWQEAVLSDITEDGFRLARPVRTRTGKLVVAGWTAWQRECPDYPRVQSCPLRARQEERPRVVTVTRGQTIKISAGYEVSRWQRFSAADFPS
jgi:hypothetical protein